MNINLTEIGYNDWYRDTYINRVPDEQEIARVIEVNKGNYLISNGVKEMRGEVTGKFMFEATTALDIPTVGDWITMQTFDDETFAIIHKTLPRKSVLKRKDPGKNIDYQLIAANIDYAFIMEAADQHFKLNRLERFLVMVQDSGIEPIILLSKSDLISRSDLKEYENEIHRLSGRYTFIPFSNKSGFGWQTITELLYPGKTYCLLGRSGVGKTTLLNKLLDESRFEVNEVRLKDYRGRHTTTRRQLVRLEAGSLFIDTPGIREIGNFGNMTGMSATFEDIYLFAEQCRYSDCTHTGDKGCAVLKAVEEGEIDEDRYNNFIKIQKESEHYARSYLEKRQRDKEFGKMVKRIMKNKHNK